MIASGDVTNHTVGIAEMKVTNERGATLITYSLGSCIGLSLYDPVQGVVGLVHCMLPLSNMDPENAKSRPCMFTDTGVTAVLSEMFQLGAQRRNIIAKVAGAAMILDEKKLFRIGERNHTVLRKVLWKNNILIAAEDVGGTVARTLRLHLDTGMTVLRIRGREVEL